MDHYLYDRSDLHSPESPPLGPVGARLWTIVEREVLDWLVRPN